MSTEILKLEKRGSTIYLTSVSSKGSELYLIRIDSDGRFFLEGGVPEDETNFLVETRGIHSVLRVR